MLRVGGQQQTQIAQLGQPARRRVQVATAATATTRKRLQVPGPNRRKMAGKPLRRRQPNARSPTSMPAGRHNARTRGRVAVAVVAIWRATDAAARIKGPGLTKLLQEAVGAEIKGKLKAHVASRKLNLANAAGSCTVMGPVGGALAKHLARMVPVENAVNRLNASAPLRALGVLGGAMKTAGGRCAAVGAVAAGVGILYDKLLASRLGLSSTTFANVVSRHGGLIQEFLAGKDIDLVPVVQDVVANLPDSGIDVVTKFLDSYSQAVTKSSTPTSGLCSMLKSMCS